MMKVFKIWVDKVGWDEYDAAVVVADSEESIRSKFEHVKDSGVSYSDNDDSFFFYKWQGEIHIEEVDLTKEAVICTSYNAG